MSLILPNLYLGNQTDANTNSNKFNTIISVVNYPFQLDHSEQYNVRLDDVSGQSIVLEIYKVADLIDRLLKQNKRVLVHCHAGVSRSASMVIGYLMIKHNMSYQNAYMHVKLKRNIICPNPGFKRQLRSLCPSILNNSLYGI